MKTILVLTDFSSSAKNAGEYACALAKQFKSKVILFHAFAVPVPSTDMPITAISVKDLEKDNLKILHKEATAIRKKSSIKVEASTSAGFAVEEAMQLEKKVKPDLIIAGMKGKNNVARILVGSVVTDVIRRAKTPVLVIPEKAKFKIPKKILLACDYKMPIEKNTLSALKIVAGKFNSEIYVVNITAETEESASVEKAIKGANLEQQLRDLNFVYYFPHRDDLLEGIDSFIKKYKTDMIAMIPHKHNLFERLFGRSNTKRMIYHTHIPLLALPEKHKNIPAYLV